MTRRITAHKGGRTARAPEARMTPQERGRLDAVLEHYSAKYVNWLIDHVEADYAEITGGNIMSGVKADYHVGDVVNVKTRGKWSTEKREITGTFYTTLTGRMYEFNNGDVIPEREIRKAK